MKTGMHPFKADLMGMARELRGLSQTQLAKKLRVTQGKVSKIENGLLTPDESFVQKLSEVLRIPDRFFFRDDRVYGMPTSFFRKRASVSQKELRAVAAELNIRRLHISRLASSLELDSIFHVPKLDLDDFDGDPTEIAAAVRYAWQMSSKPIKNLFALLEDAGCIVVPCDFGPKIDAISQWVPDSSPMIFINRNKPMDRLRFSVAHELGHLVMHSRAPTDQMEPEADAFAAEFLMPASEITAQIPRRLRLSDLATLKGIWKVSMAAILKRAETLNRITERQYRYLWMQMGKHGYRSKEPIELDVAPEKCTTITQMFDVHRSEFEYTDQDLLEMLDLSEDDFAAWYGMPTKGRLRLVK